MRSVNIGIIGLGTVGGGVVRLIQRHHDDYVEHYGIDLQIKRACSRNDAEAKNLGIADIFTTNWQDVTSDPTIDIVIELIGGEHPATEIFEDSVRARQARGFREQGTARPPCRAPGQARKQPRRAN